MSYSCECSYDMPSVTSTRKVKASRKPRRCCECGYRISIGEPYTSTWGIWEGDPQTYVHCALCADLLEWALISVPCFCWLYEGLHEDVAAMVSEVRHDVPGFAFEAGRRAVKIRRQVRAQKGPRAA
jgi:hypothetical protein